MTSFIQAEVYSHYAGISDNSKPRIDFMLNKLGELFSDSALRILNYNRQISDRKISSHQSDTWNADLISSIFQAKMMIEGAISKVKTIGEFIDMDLPRLMTQKADSIIAISNILKGGNLYTHMTSVLQEKPNNYSNSKISSLAVLRQSLENTPTQNRTRVIHTPSKFESESKRIPRRSAEKNRVLLVSSTERKSSRPVERQSYKDFLHRRSSTKNSREKAPLPQPFKSSKKSRPSYEKEIISKVRMDPYSKSKLKFERTSYPQIVKKETRLEIKIEESEIVSDRHTEPGAVSSQTYSLHPETKFMPREKLHIFDSPKIEKKLSFSPIYEESLVKEASSRVQLSQYSVNDFQVVRITSDIRDLMMRDQI